MVFVLNAWKNYMEINLNKDNKQIKGTGVTAGLFPAEAAAPCS